MAVVNHRQCAVAIGQVANVAKIGDRAVHRKHAVGHDEFLPAIRRLFQPGLQVIHIVVAIAKSLRLAEPDTVDDAGMIERVADDRVIGRQKRFEQAAVGVEAGRIEDRVIRPQPRADARLEFLVNGLRAADEAHRRHPVAEVVERAMCGFEDRRVVGETEIVVGTQVQHVGGAAVFANRDFRLLWSRDDAFRFVEALGFQRFGALRERLKKFRCHVIALVVGRAQSISGQDFDQASGRYSFRGTEN